MPKAVSLGENYRHQSMLPRRVLDMCLDTNGTCVEINQRVRFSENYCESASSTSTPSSRRSYGMTSHRWRTSRLICFPHRMEHSDLFIKPTHATYYRLDLCATQPLSQVHLDNSSQGHCPATTQPCWPSRVVRDPHHHAIEQTPR